MVSLPSPREIYHEKPVRALFESIDTSGDGVVTFREMILGIHDKGLDWASCGLDPEKVNMRLADADGDQSVNFEEFWRCVMKSGKGQREDPAENAKEYLESVCMATCVALARSTVPPLSLSLSLSAHVLVMNDNGRGSFVSSLLDRKKWSVQLILIYVSYRYNRIRASQ